MRKNSWFLRGLTALLLAATAAFSSNWEVPLEVSTGIAGPDDPPIIVADFEDNAAMIWNQGGEVYTSYRPFEGTWEAPTNHGKGNSQRICMDESGNITIAFITTTNPDQINTAFRAAGGAWTSVLNVASGTAANTVQRLTLDCISTNFQAYIAWYDSGAPDIRSIYRNGSGTSWAGSVVIATTGTLTPSSTPTPIIKVHQSGNAVIGVRLTDTTGPTVDMYALYTTSPGGAYTSTALGFTNPPGTSYDFDMDNNGNAVLAARSSTNDIKASTSSDASSGSWNAVQTVSSATGTDVKVGIDENGLASIVWVTDSAPVIIQTANATVGAGSWAPIIDLTDSTGSTVGDPRIHVSSNGYRIIAWDFPATNTANQLFVIRGQNATLEATSSVIDSTITAKSLNVYTSTTSRGFASWVDLTGNQFAEASRTFEPIDATTNLLRALGKKRLIYQPTRYP